VRPFVLLLLILYQLHDKQQYNGADSCSDDGSDHTARMDAKGAKQEAADYGAHYSNEYVTQHAKPAAFHQRASQPAGNSADYQKYNQAIDVHETTSGFLKS